MNTETTARRSAPAAGDNLLIGRMYEVKAARELEMLAPDAAPAAPFQSGSPTIEHGRESGTDSLEADRGAETGNERVMPFIGRILQHAPGAFIVIERILYLKEDLYLADHAFVHAQDIKPLSECLPVLPMTFSLEVMAEAAACLIPGHGLIGFEDIKATRWIELADTDELSLHITAEHRDFDPVKQVYRIEAAIYIKGQNQPAISAGVLFASHYRLDLTLERFTELIEVKRLQAEQLYRERHLFHGPRLHCLVGEISLGDHGASGTLLTRASGDLFQSLPNPQLLIDPALLDGVGQLLAIWAMELHQRSAFPVGFKKLELYQATPPADTRVSVHIEVTRDEIKTLHADIELQDGAGAVWLRIQDWRMWKFRWPPKLLDFSRRPTQCLVSDPYALPAQAPASICRVLSKRDLTGFDAGLLTRFYLQRDEFSTYTGKAAVPQRQSQWLLGRIAAKDAVRAWVADQSPAAAMLHPASFTIANDRRGQPVMSGPTMLESPLPRISIAHCEDRAIAVADSGAVGIDIERISARAPDFLKTLSNETEQDLLREYVDRTAASDKSEVMTTWITRFWCAKEAVGKLLGTGVAVARQFEIVGIETEGFLRIRPPNSDSIVAVGTVRDGDFIIAHASASARDSGEHERGGDVQPTSQGEGDPD